MAIANPEYVSGMAAMQNKNYNTAVNIFPKCIQLDAENIKCHWELGWAYWMKNDWRKVVDSWNRVRELNPKHKDLNRYLSQAQDNLKLNNLLDENKVKAPKRLRKQWVVS